MTIHDLLLQFDDSYIDTIRDDLPGKTLVTFRRPYYYDDCEQPILQFLALYDKFTKQVQAIKIYGLNMLYTLKYFQEPGNQHIFRCNFWHYMEDIHAPVQSITFLI